VAAVLQGNDISTQRKEQSEGLAKEFAQYLGLEFAIPCNSGTAALHMCVAGLEIGPGDEVITTAHTYWATAAAVLHHNAVPVFVDIDPKTYCMDPALIEERITTRTKAIIPVHIHGIASEMDPIMDIAKRRGLAVIEDCAQAHGTKYRGRICGTIGICTGFSLQASKHLTTGSEGGIFATNDYLVNKRAQTLQYLGEIVVPGRERQEQQYNARGMGWMYRGDVFGQAFARSQLRRLEPMLEARIRNCRRLTEKLKGLKGIRTPYEPGHIRHTYYNYVVTVHPEELGLSVSAKDFLPKFETALRAEGMEVGRWQRMPVPGQSIFQSRSGYGKGCPWKCQHAGDVAYDAKEYPRATQFIDAALYVFGIWPPNDLALMDKFAEAIGKVLEQPEQIMQPPAK
jgi:dTDP-4-amino-4,6-dideoxygalactose transaminase